ncbi:Internalin-J precursor [compost metagenome]
MTFINTSTAVVYIADTGLKAYLVGRADINTNNDNEIQASEALAFTGIIEYVNKGLTDATGVEAFVNITKLFLYNNNLTTLNVTKNTALTHLDLGKNQLVNLDVSKNTSLVDLFCFENQLTALNVTQNTKLKNLACYTNQIASLDVSKNIELLDFRCFENQLTSLDVTKNTLLTSLDVGSNQLTVFDVSKNIALTGLRCNNNKLTSFDISKNTVLSGLICIQNQLTSLNLKNGNNAILTTLWTQNNPSLTCIQVDNVANANSYTTAGNWQKDATAIYNTNCDPIVNIPDANFKSYLLSVSSINTNGDNEIQVSEATAFTGTIDCSNRNIASLVGIEAFVKLTNLFCSGNQLTSLDVSKNTALDRLNCFNNQITALDVSKNVALTFLSSTTNPIKTLNVSKNTLLTILYCGNNQLTALDISKNTALKELSCHINQLTSLDISRNILLNEVYAYNNRLTSVDASKNTNLTIFSAHTNNLTALNIKNGQNSKITNFEVRLNPNLTCIQVDNVTSASSYSNWFKDATASYNINCGETLGLSENKSSYLTVYPNPVKDILNFSEQVSDIKITDLSGRTIKQISASTNGINVSNLSKGTYIVTATTKAGNTITKKIIKE